MHELRGRSTPEHHVQQAAEMMVKHDCGEIAVVETEENLKPIGLITDRDIACRVVGTAKVVKRAQFRSSAQMPFRSDSSTLEQYPQF